MKQKLALGGEEPGPKGSSCSVAVPGCQLVSGAALCLRRQGWSWTMPRCQSSQAQERRGDL